MINPEKKSIELILGNTKVTFSIPTYQRQYDWGKTEIYELLNDIQEVEESTDKELFLGNIIFDISNKKEYKIVDGQQRLTTISIVLIALREQAKKLKEVVVANEIQNYISNYSKMRSLNDLKLNVASNIKDIYEHMANPNWDESFPIKIGKTSIKRQVNKIKPLYKNIEQFIKDFNVEKLSRFGNSLRDAFVVVINVEDDQDVFKIFERTNARGLDLNIGDLLKNYIFSYKINNQEEKWDEIVENAESNLPRMLKYFWVSRNGYIKQSDLYKSLKKYVIDGKGIDIFLEELHLFSNFYASTQSTTNENLKIWLLENKCHDIADNQAYLDKVFRVFQALKLFRITQAYPVIFALFNKYFETGNKPKRLFDVLEAIERYHFVNNIIVGRIGNDVEKYYAELCPKITKTDKTDWDKLVTSIINDLKKKKAKRDEFITNFDSNICYSTKNIELISYVLDRINNFDKSKKELLSGAQYLELFTPQMGKMKRNYNIEHILPQDSKKNLPQEEAELIDDIGNLLIIPRHSNSVLGNKSPKDKLAMMKNNPKLKGNLNHLEEFIKNYEKDIHNWDHNLIKKRTESFAIDGYDLIWNF